MQEELYQSTRWTSVAPSPICTVPRLSTSGGEHRPSPPVLGQPWEVLFPPPPTATARLAVAVVMAVSMLLTDPPSKAAPSAILAEGTAPAAVAASWRWPLDEPRILTRPYVAPATPYSSGHRGIDIGTRAAVGATVYAPASGVVSFAGVVVDRPVLSINHGSGLVSSFEPVTSHLVAGEQVHAGQVVGQLHAVAAGAAHCRSPCLHFGVRHHGEYLSPLNFLGGIPHSVLLPTRELARPPDGAADVVTERRHEQ